VGEDPRRMLAWRQQPGAAPLRARQAVAPAAARCRSRSSPGTAAAAAGGDSGSTGGGLLDDDEAAAALPPCATSQSCKNVPARRSDVTLPRSSSSDASNDDHASASRPLRHRKHASCRWCDVRRMPICSEVRLGQALVDFVNCLLGCVCPQNFHSTAVVRISQRLAIVIMKSSHLNSISATSIA
jgi:hypothetical protein